jgi:hypothetical protein
MDNLFQELSASTRTNRINFLNSIGVSPSNYGKLADINKIMKTYIKNSGKSTTQSTRCWHVIKFLEAIGNTELAEAYKAASQFIIKESFKKQADTTTTDRAERYAIKLDELQDILSKKAPVFSSLENTISSVKVYQNYLLMRLYANEPALRNDYWGMKIVNKAADINTEGNFLVLNPKVCYFYLNRFKNANHLGPQRIPISKDTVKVIRDLMKLYKRTDIEPEYLFNQFEGGVVSPTSEDTMKKRIKYVANEYFGVPLSINDWRHLHEIQTQSSDKYKDMSYEEKQLAHRRLLHSMTTGLKYNRLV